MFAVPSPYVKSQNEYHILMSESMDSNFKQCDLILGMLRILTGEGHTLPMKVIRRKQDLDNYWEWDGDRG